MSKKDFIKKQLAERGIYDYTEEDLKQLKMQFIENLFIYRDKYKSFEEAFKIWRKDEKERI